MIGFCWNRLQEETNSTTTTAGMSARWSAWYWSVGGRQAAGSVDGRSWACWEGPVLCEVIFATGHSECAESATDGEGGRLLPTGCRRRVGRLCKRSMQRIREGGGGAGVQEMDTGERGRKWKHVDGKLRPATRAAACVVRAGQVVGD